MKLYCESGIRGLNRSFDVLQVVLVSEKDWVFDRLKEVVVTVFDFMGGFDKSRSEIIYPMSVPAPNKDQESLFCVCSSDDEPSFSDKYIRFIWDNETKWELVLDNENSKSGLRVTVQFYSTRREMAFLFFKGRDLSVLFNEITTNDPMKSEEGVSVLVDQVSCSFLFQAAQRAF